MRWFNVSRKSEQQILHFVGWDCELRRYMDLRNAFLPKLSQYHLPDARALGWEAIRFIRAVLLINSNAECSVLPIREQTQFM